MIIILFITILLLSLKISVQNTAYDNLLLLELLQNHNYDEVSEILQT